MTADPLAEVLDAINVAREQLDAAWNAVEDLQDADRAYVTARIRPHFDMWRARIAHVERQRLANELTALRTERDAAHEECARLTGGLVIGHATVHEYDSGEVVIEWDSDETQGAVVHRSFVDRAVALASWMNFAERVVGPRLVEVILEDADRIATLTAERDHARSIAVALEQEAAVRYSGNRVPMDSDRTPEVER